MNLRRTTYKKIDLYANISSVRQQWITDLLFTINLGVRSFFGHLKETVHTELHPGLKLRVRSLLTCRRVPKIYSATASKNSETMPLIPMFIPWGFLAWFVDEYSNAFLERAF